MKVGGSTVNQEATMKSTVDEIRARFDNDVERFSNLETGQSAAIDAPIALDLVAGAASLSTPDATQILDVGCGAGNFVLRLLELLPATDVTLIDLSRPMLDQAVARIRETYGFQPAMIQGDIREISLDEQQFDIILAGAVLHHLRTDDEWKSTFEKLYRSLKAGGSLWIFDMVASSTNAVHDLMWQRYGEYLSALQDDAYRDHVFGYVEKEDTPRSLIYQVELLRDVGFDVVEILHYNTCFAAFGGIKA